MSSTNQRWSLPLLLTVTLSAACTPEDSGDQAGPSENPSEDAAPAAPDTGSERVEAETDETRLANLQMLTFAGENAEAYWNPAADELIFQATRPGLTECDQIFTMDDRGRNLQLVSTGEGRTTCAYFFPGGDRILYSSTHAENRACPPPPEYSRGYVWALYDYDVYTANPDGSRLERLTETPGYDAEATISSDGEKIVFTSTRDGDLEIYTMDPDGTDLRRLTHEAGYDGGPFFSADGTKIVYRAYHPTDPEELEDYRSLLAEGLVRPATLEIFVMDADGSHKRQITSNGAANFGPFFHPDGERIIFSSNLHAPDGRNFDLYLINVDGTGLERVTTHPEFDGFPMFTSDGSRLVFASNRHNRQQGDTNVFVAEWVEDPATETEEEGP
jgi:Tol biopolymer transport system component